MSSEPMIPQKPVPELVCHLYREQRLARRQGIVGQANTGALLEARAARQRAIRQMVTLETACLCPACCPAHPATRQIMSLPEKMGKREQLRHEADVLEEEIKVEMDLSIVSTKDLVEELSKREAVQRIDVAPLPQKIEIAVTENGEFLFDEIFDGPQIILRVWD